MSKEEDQRPIIGYPIRRMQGQATEWEMTSATYITNA